MIVAFMGIDGSGKTSLCKSLKNKLDEMGLMTEYREAVDYFVIKRFLRFFGIREKKRSFSLDGNETKKVFFIHKLWPFFVWIDLLLEWIWIKIWKNGKIVLFDRYAYDFLVGWECHGSLTRITRWLFHHFPKPKIGFVLDVPIKIAQKRKRGEGFNIGFLKKKRLQYLELSKKLRMKTIDTNKPLSKTSQKIYQEFRKSLIDELSDENKLLSFISYPNFKPRMLKKLNIQLDWKNINWEYVIDSATKNKVVETLCKNLLNYYEKELPREIKHKIKRILFICNQYHKTQTRTLEFLTSLLRREEVDFVIMKSLPPYDDVIGDIDFLVKKKDFKRVKNMLREMFPKGVDRVDEISFIGDEIVKIDLHHEISYINIRHMREIKCMDEKLVFKRKRKIKFDEKEVSVPSVEDEILILSAHSLFSHHYTTLGELFYIMELFKKVDERYLINHSKMFGWDKLLRIFLSYLKVKYQILYDVKSKINSERNVIKVKVDLKPVFFHPLFLFRKKSLRELLNLLVVLLYHRMFKWKVRKILTYDPNWLKAIDAI